MAEKLNISYDEVGDILYLETVKPYAEQETTHLGPDVLGRINPRTGGIENIEILFFSKRAKRGKGLVLPVSADLQFFKRKAARPRRRAPKKGSRT